LDAITVILVTTVATVIVSILSLWLIGRWRVGAERAKFTDAIWISVVSAVAGAIINQFMSGGIGSLLQIVIGLYLVKRYYETDWGNAAIISVVAGILSVIVVTVLAVVLGIGGGIF
jgi:hypothetical protein